MPFMKFPSLPDFSISSKGHIFLIPYWLYHLIAVVDFDLIVVVDFDND